MKHIGLQLKKSVQKTKDTERGELLEYFCGRINPERMRDGYSKVSIGRMAKLLQGIPTKDLYYLKRVCDDAGNFSKKFWWELKPENHTPEARAKQAEKFKADLKTKRFQRRD